MVPTSTQAEYLSMVPTSTQAEFSRWIQMKNATSTQVERSFRKMAERLLHGRCCSLSDFGSKSKVYRYPGRAPIICGRQQGVQDVGLSSILF
ncbi:hypothetical protein TNCV_2982111 [Trichonephila clavipes]|nr:hypothetical protein TNCV_2982111 [Trichonephila clavipes]